MKIFSESETESIGSPDSPSEVEQEIGRISLNLGAIRAVIAFASAKGGVGKSAILTNVACALALKGRKVGLLDADLNSPSVAAMLGMRRVKVFPIGDGIDPASGPLGLRVIGNDLLAESEPRPLNPLDEESPVIANGVAPVEMSRPAMLRRLLGQTRFGAIDFLLIDAAPGVAELELIARIAPLTGVMLLSHPSELAVQAAKAALGVAAKAQTPVLGIVENMTGFYCGNCHSIRPLLPQGDMVALMREKGVPIIARLSFDPRLAETCDSGAQFVREYADAPLARQLTDLAGHLEGLLATQPHRDQP